MPISFKFLVDSILIGYVVQVEFVTIATVTKQKRKFLIRSVFIGIISFKMDIN